MIYLFIDPLTKVRIIDADMLPDFFVFIVSRLEVIAYLHAMTQIISYCAIDLFQRQYWETLCVGFRRETFEPTINN